MCALKNEHVGFFLCVEEYILLYTGYVVFVSDHIFVIMCDFRSCSILCHRTVQLRQCMRLIGSWCTQWMNGSGSYLVSGARV